MPEAVDAAGHLVEDRGMSPVPGLFHVGRSWQTSRASALLCGVAFDAATVVRHVTRLLRHAPAVVAAGI
jgi:putative flavoprotein involved in K+ transport